MACAKILVLNNLQCFPKLGLLTSNIQIAWGFIKRCNLELEKQSVCEVGLHLCKFSRCPCTSQGSCVPFWGTEFMPFGDGIRRDIIFLKLL